MDKSMSGNSQKDLTNAIAKQSDPADVAEMFKLVVSKSYCEMQIFPGPILIKKDDLKELYSQFASKAKRQDLQGANFNAIVSFESNKSTEYGSWDSLNSGSWETAEITKSLVLKWNFLVRLPNVAKPEHHSVVVRLCNAMHPVQYLQAAFSKNPDELEKIEFDDAPMLCRVSVPDSLLSKELIEIAANWNKARRRPFISIPWIKNLKRYSAGIGEIISFSVYVFTIVAYFAWYLDKFFIGVANSPFNLGHVKLIVIMFVSFIVVANFANRFSKWLGGVAERQLDKFGRFTVFELTNGDNNKQTENFAKNQSSLYKFVSASVFSIFWNIVAGYAVYYWTLPINLSPLGGQVNIQSIPSASDKNKN